MDLFLFAMQQLAPARVLFRAYFLEPMNTALRRPVPEQQEEMTVNTKPVHSLCR